MVVTVLVSCMFKECIDIIRESNIQTNAVIVNQCDNNSVELNDFTNKRGKVCRVKYICTTERGLSNSRNMALLNADGCDICYLCDDDEYLSDDFEDIIIDAHKNIPSIL